MLSRGEPVRVGVVFGPGSSIRPVWFDRKGRQHRVATVTYVWHEREGATTTIHFTVTVRDENTLYELVFDTGRQGWSLAALETQ